MSPKRFESINNEFLKKSKNVTEFIFAAVLLAKIIWKSMIFFTDFVLL